LRLSGITLPLTDALIATIAKRNAVPVLTVDAHFQHLTLSLVDLGTS
jgi:predicted nucleic acid-binding protein